MTNMNSSLELVAFVTRSENRVMTLGKLVAGPFTRPELQEETNIPRATLSRILADCWQRDLVTKNGHHYQITPLGEYVASQLQSMADSIETLNKLQAIEQWLPVDAFGFDLVDLAGAEVTLQTLADPHAPVNAVLQVLKSAGHLRAVCDNAVHEPIITEWRAVTLRGQRMEAVVTADVVDVIASDPERAARFGEMIVSEHAEGFVYDGDIPCLIAIADETVLLEAADEDGAIKGFIISENDAVYQWAEATVEAYQSEAEPIDAKVLAP